jgi:hypothetical protein
MWRSNTARAIALMLVASLGCTDTARLGSHSANLETEEEIWGQPTTPVDYDCDDCQAIDGEVVEPGDTCSSPGDLAADDDAPECADDEDLAKVLELVAQAEADFEQAKAALKAATEKSGVLLQKAEVQAAFKEKAAVVLVNGKVRQTIGGVPKDIADQIKTEFAADKAGAHGGWTYDAAQSQAIAPKGFVTQEELDHLVDATDKGAGGIFGSAYRLENNRYALVKGNKVIIYGYQDTASNPYHRPPMTLHGDGFTWPDDEATFDPVAKWLTAHRWRAYVPKGMAYIGTDPARTRDQMIQAAIARAVEDVLDASNPFNWENAYMGIQILPVVGTIDAVQRGDCPDAVASALTDVATLAGFWPAKVFRLGKLRVPARLVTVALDGGSIGIRIAYQKDGTWVEAVVLAALQARALKQAFTPLIKNQRLRAAAAVSALAALSVACDDAEKAIDEAVAAETKYQETLDKLEKARLKLEDSIKIPCGAPDPDADSSPQDETFDGSDDVPASDVCEASWFDGGLADAFATHPGAVPVVPANDDDLDIEEATAELIATASALETSVEAAPIYFGNACQVLEELSVLTPMHDAVPVMRIKQSSEQAIALPLVALETTEQDQTQQTGPQPVPPPPPPAPQPGTTPPPPPAPTCAPSPAYPAIADLVSRYKAAYEKLQTIWEAVRARRAAINRALVVSFTVQLGTLYGVGTASIEQLITKKLLDFKKDFVTDKVPWDADIERGMRLSILIMAAEAAIQNQPFEELPISAAGPAKDAALAKLKSYLKSYEKNQLTMQENVSWLLDKKVNRLRWAILSLPEQEEWMKGCTPVTPEMLKQYKLPTQGDQPVVISPDQFAAYVKQVDTDLAAFEAALKKAEVVAGKK